MTRLGKSDLEQMGEDYFRHLKHEVLVEVAKNLHELAVEQLEKLAETSKTSSRPPSSDDPFRKKKSNIPSEVPLSPEEKKGTEPEPTTEPPPKKSKEFGEPKRKAGKQPGANMGCVIMFQSRCRDSVG